MKDKILVKYLSRLRCFLCGRRGDGLLWMGLLRLRLLLRLVRLTLRYLILLDCGLRLRLRRRIARRRLSDGERDMERVVDKLGKFQLVYAN